MSLPIEFTFSPEKADGASEVQEEEQRALAQAQESSSVMVQGLTDGHVQQGCMGMYELYAGTVINKRCVWRLCDVPKIGSSREERFLYYGYNQKNGSKKWYISTREHMEAGRATGFMKVDSIAFIPDKIRAPWLANDGADAWPAEPGVEVQKGEVQRGAL